LTFETFVQQILKSTKISTHNAML